MCVLSTVLTGIAIFLHFFNGEEFVKIQKNSWNITCNKYDDDAKQHNGTSSILCVMFCTSNKIRNLLINILRKIYVKTEIRHLTYCYSPSTWCCFHFHYLSSFCAVEFGFDGFWWLWKLNCFRVVKVGNWLNLEQISHFTSGKMMFFLFSWIKI